MPMKRGAEYRRIRLKSLVRQFTNGLNAQETVLSKLEKSKNQRETHAEFCQRIRREQPLLFVGINTIESFLECADPNTIRAPRTVREMEWIRLFTLRLNSLRERAQPFLFAREEALRDHIPFLGAIRHRPQFR